MELSLVTYRISKIKHKLDGYIGAQPLRNDDGKVTALTVWRWEEKRDMNIDVFELVPDNDKPRKDCYDCLGCSHLVALNVDSKHNASIECDIDSEDIEL